MTNAETIDAVAQAIRDVVARRIGPREGKGKPWDNLPAALREEYRAEALAAIEAYKATQG